MTISEYKDLLNSQNGVCAICKEKEKVKKLGEIQPLSVDHCHKTNKVRGILCVNCNSILGHAKDNVDILRAAIDYLIKSSDLPLSTRTA